MTYPPNFDKIRAVELGKLVDAAYTQYNERTTLGNAWQPAAIILPAAVLTMRSTLTPNSWLSRLSGDLEAAARCLSVMAALLHWPADNFGKKRFHYQAGFRMIDSDRRKHTAISTKESLSLAFLNRYVTAQSLQHTQCKIQFADCAFCL